MSVTILKAGILDTVQDLGRIGKGMFGIGPGGAMDQYAAKMANTLAGNANSEALIEIHFPGPLIYFGQDTLISITGADFTPVLNEQTLPCWQPVAVRKNTSLHFSECKWGARAYLAFHGGLDIPKWMNSYSTHLKVGLGGWKGRKLEKGDALPIQSGSLDLERLFKSSAIYRILPWKSAFQNVYQEISEIYFITGPEWDDLEEEAKDNFLKTRFAIQSSSDRMGYQLHSEAVLETGKKDILSSAVSFGTLQLLPGGQLIVLMADHQTTGGYPRLGHVISAHHPKLAQLSAGSEIHFTPVDIQTAENLYFEKQRQLNMLQRACRDHLNALV